MSNTDDKSIFFLTLSFISIWVILDNIYGKRYLDTFLSNVFPFYRTDEEPIQEITPDIDTGTDSKSGTVPESDTGIISPGQKTTESKSNAVNKIYSLFKKAGDKLAIMKGGTPSTGNYGLVDIMIDPDGAKEQWEKDQKTLDERLKIFKSQINDGKGLH